MVDQNIEAVRQSFAAYAANVDKLVEQHKADVAKIVADAIAKDDADEAVDLQKLKAEIDAANAKLVIPPFEPSGNG